MYVCVCRAVTEDEVRDCVASGASTVRQVRDACGAGADCGSCLRRICALINSAPMERAEGLMPVS